jgi:hypothetical protein
MRRHLFLFTLLLLTASAASAVPLPVHNHSFETGSGFSNPPWLSTTGQHVGAIDSRSLHGAQLGYLGDNNSTFGQIIATSPGVALTQLQYQPGTLYTLKAYAMSGGGATRYTTLALRGEGFQANQLGANTLASQLFDVDFVTSPTTNYVLAPDGITYWREMVLTLDTSVNPAAVGQYMSISADVSLANIPSSPNFDSFTLEATSVPEPGGAAVLMGLR